MRVRATAIGSSKSNAIGQLELSCTPLGLTLGMHGVGAYSEGQATGALTNGTQFTVPYGDIRTARVTGEQLYLELDSPGLPHDRLTLSRFTAGPGVPPLELRRRRLILHVAALSVGALACLAAVILAPSQPNEHLAWGALGYGALAASIIIALGLSLGRSLFVRLPGEKQTLEAFITELSLHYPAVIRSGDLITREKKKRPLRSLNTFLPRTAGAIGMTLAAAILTALVTGQRLVMERVGEPSSSIPRSSIQADQNPEPTPTEAPNRLEKLEVKTVELPSGGLPPPASTDDRTLAPGGPLEGDQLTIERRCVCDRATSQLWSTPIPLLSGVLIDRRSIQLKSFVRTEIQIAIVNNGDAPVDDITLHIQFFEQRGKKRVPTKERPLYFEGPLRPGEAIKWKTKARGTDFDVIVPNIGTLGPDGDGAAPAEKFRILLQANHRPVRLHAARMLSYLGDDISRKAALDLKDAMRAAEAPYLRRILAATGNNRVCDLGIREEMPSKVGVCIYNASDAQLQDVGVQLNHLSSRMNVDQPLALPPSLISSRKWKVSEMLEAHSGLYVSLPLPADFESGKKNSLEAVSDRYDLLD